MPGPNLFLIYLFSIAYVFVMLTHGHIRWATMMSTDRAQDGYSKILNKTDCEKLKGNNKKEAVKECECPGSIQVFF